VCLITEHAHAKKRIKELETEVVQLNEQVEQFKEQYEPELPTGYPTFDISWADLKAELEALGVQCMLLANHIPDSFVRHTDEANWAKIMPFLTYSANLYVEGVADCDDYSRWAAADSSKKFKLNGCLECWGDMPLGYHAFNLVRIGTGKYKIFEPNAGFEDAGTPMDFGEQGYLPKCWRL